MSNVHCKTIKTIRKKMINYNFLDRPARKKSILTKIQYVLVGILILLINFGLLYVIYRSSEWIALLFEAPLAVTIVLMLVGLMIFGGIVLILLVLGLVALYMGIFG